MKGLDAFCSVCEHKSGLTGHETCPHSIEVVLVLLDLDREVGDIVIDLPCQPPVISVGHSGLKDLELAAGASE
jgi:hypothetical protein